MYSQPCRKCYYHVFADPDWPHSRHTLMAIIITTSRHSRPIRARYSPVWPITSRYSDIIKTIACPPTPDTPDQYLQHFASQPHNGPLHYWLSALSLNINTGKTGIRSGSRAKSPAGLGDVHCHWTREGEALTILDRHSQGPERGRADQRLNNNLSEADLDSHKSRSDL